MTRVRPSKETPHASWVGVPSLALAALALCAGVLFYLAPREQLGYDSFWHVFVARQDHWWQFWFEVADNAHPPLYYLVLKATLLLGNSLVVYRLPSMASTVISGALLYGIAARVVANRWLPGIATLAFCLSYTTITVGLEARSYALATSLTLAGLYFYLSLAETAFADNPKDRRRFACFMTLALLTHYSVVFVAVAAVLSPVLLAAVDPGYRTRVRRAWAQSRPANLLTIGAPIGVFGLFYLGHARRWVHRIQHLPEFMFDPARESLVAFCWRTTRAEIELLTPIPVTGVAVLAAAAVLLVPLSRLLARGGAHRRAERRVAAILLPVMLAIMAGLALATAVAGRYPFGGPLRHQFFLFPFATLSFVIALDRIDQALPVGWQRRAFMLIAVAGCVASIGGWMSQFRVTPGLMLQAAVDAFRSSLPTTRAVYVDQFSLIPFFMHHHEWQWRLEDPDGPPSQFRVWTLSKDGRELRVCRDRAHWQLDVSDAKLYSNLVECLDATAETDVGLFRLKQTSVAPGSEADLEALMEALAVNAGLQPVSIVIRTGEVFAAFERGPR